MSNNPGIHTTTEIGVQTVIGIDTICVLMVTSEHVLRLANGPGFSSGFARKIHTDTPTADSTAPVRHIGCAANDYMIRWSSQLPVLQTAHNQHTIESSDGHRCPSNCKYTGSRCSGCYIGRWSGSGLPDLGPSRWWVRCWPLGDRGLVEEAMSGNEGTRVRAGGAATRGPIRMAWPVCFSVEGPVEGHAAHLPYPHRAREDLPTRRSRWDM